jgi:DNA-binding response OmpR family regulator
MSSILVVEDVPAIAEFVERGLRAHGHGTTVTDDEAAALEYALNADFDLLVLDLGLPEGSGL